MNFVLKNLIAWEGEPVWKLKCMLLGREHTMANLKRVHAQHEAMALDIEYLCGQPTWIERYLAS